MSAVSVRLLTYVRLSNCSVASAGRNRSAIVQARRCLDASKDSNH